MIEAGTTSSVDFALAGQAGARAGARPGTWHWRLARLIFRPAVRQGLVVLADQGLASLTTFATGVLVARSCGADRTAFGRCVFGMTIVVTAMGLQRGLTSLPFTVLHPHVAGRDRAGHLGSTMVHQMIFSALVAAGIAAVALVRCLQVGWDAVGAVLFALSMASVGLLCQDFVRCVLLADLRVWANLGMGLACRLSTLAGLGWVYAAGALSVPATYAIVAVCSVGPALAMVWHGRRRLVIVRGRLAADFRRNWQTGKWVVACHAMYTLTGPVLPWLLAVVWGGEQLAVLGVCQGAAGLVGCVGRGLASFLLPKMSHVSASQGVLARAVRSCVVALSVLGVGYVVLGWAAGEWIVTAIYSKAYAGCGGVLLLCFVTAAVSLVSVPVAMAVHVLKRSDVAFKGLLAAAPVTILLGGALTWRWGAWGACVGLLLGWVIPVAYWGWFLAGRLSRRAGRAPAAPAEHLIRRS